MEAIRDYLLSVTAAALICGIVNSLSENNGSVSGMLKLLCGLFLAAVVLKPAVDIKLKDIYAITDRLEIDSRQVIASGEEIADEEMKRIIKEKSEAYILDKAKALGMEIDAEIILEDLVPARVIVTGNLSPFAKSSLSASITQELAIPPEEQIWKNS